MYVAAVDVDQLSCGVAGAFAEEEGRHVGDLFGRGHAIFQRDVLYDGFEACLRIGQGLDPAFVEGGPAFGDDDRVDADAVFAVVASPFAGEGAAATVGGGVGAGAALAGLGGFGADVDDRAFRGFECRQGMLGQEVVVNKIFVEGGHEGVVVTVLESYAVVDAGVVDQAVDAAERSEDCLYRLFRGFWIGEFCHRLVSLAAGGLYRGDGGFVVGLVPADDEGDGAFGGEHFYDAFADAFGATANDDNLVFKLQIHCILFIRFRTYGTGGFLYIFFYRHLAPMEPGAWRLFCSII